jgi:hypothetical protein
MSGTRLNCHGRNRDLGGSTKACGLATRAMASSLVRSISSVLPLGLELARALDRYNCYDRYSGGGATIAAPCGTRMDEASVRLVRANGWVKTCLGSTKGIWG